MSDEELRLEAARIAITFTGVDLNALRAAVNGIVSIVRGRPQESAALRTVWTEDLNAELRACHARGLGPAGTVQHLRTSRGLSPSINAVKAQRTKLGLGNPAKRLRRAA